MEKIDKLDKQILEIISQNARIPFKDVAAECGVSRAAIHQRVQRLIDLGVIIGSGYHVNPKSLGYSTCTYVGIKLEKGSMYKSVVAELKKIPEIVETCRSFCRGSRRNSEQCNSYHRSDCKQCRKCKTGTGYGCTSDRGSAGSSWSV